jgi:hypothetical protein
MTTSPPTGDADIAGTTAKLRETSSRSVMKDLLGLGARTTALLGIDFML